MTYLAEIIFLLLATGLGFCLGMGYELQRYTHPVAEENERLCNLNRELVNVNIELRAANAELHTVVTWSIEALQARRDSE